MYEWFAVSFQVTDWSGSLPEARATVLCSTFSMSTFADSMCNDPRLTADNAEFLAETARVILESISWEHVDLDAWKWFILIQDGEFGHGM